MSKKTIELKDVVVGNSYWVVNGHWTFTVKEKREDGVIIDHHEINRTDLIPYNQVLILEESTRLDTIEPKPYTMKDHTKPNYPSTHFIPKPIELEQEKSDKEFDKEHQLDKPLYTQDSLLSILREYREYAWINGLTRYDLEQWIVKKFNINPGEHFSKKK